MSDQDDRIDGVARAVLMAIIDQSEIRDLQRRVGQLEQQQR
jgi:hypothetical protein